MLVYLLMTLVVILWTASSFGCHFFAKAFLTLNSDLNHLGAILITSFQLTCIFSILEFNNQTGLASNGLSKSILVFIAHALGTFSTNMRYVKNILRVNFITKIGITVFLPGARKRRV